MARDSGPEGPPGEAYGTATNLERFAVLHTEAKVLIESLEHHYTVHRLELPVPSFPLQVSLDQTQPAIQLSPHNRGAASIEIAFTALPGLAIRCGRSIVELFPTCGCDACAETGEEEVERMSWWVGQLVAGRLREHGEGGFEIWDSEGNEIGRGNPRRRSRTNYDYAPWAIA